MTETRAEQLTPKGGLNLFEKIAVCLDGSELAEQIIPYAAEQASRFGSALVLIRVVADPIFTSPGVPGLPGVPVVTSGMDRQVQKEERESEAYLERVAKRLLAENRLQAESVTLLGDPGLAVVEYAAANGVGLVAVATHGRSGPGRVLFGSVADYIVRHSRLPILLIRPTLGRAS